MNKINFVFLDDNQEDFNYYTSVIKNVLHDMGIPHSLTITYEQGKYLINKYWQYLKDGNGTGLNDEIQNFNLLSDNTICFIDDNWDNTSSPKNCDGKNFVEKFLNNNELQNVIMVTVNPDSYGSAYVKKNRQFASKLSMVLQKVAPYKKYKRPDNKNAKTNTEEKNANTTKKAAE